MDLMESHGLAVTGYPMSGLDVIGKGHGHEAIYCFVKDALKGRKTEIKPKLCKRDRPLIVSLQVFASPTGSAMK